MSTVTAQINRGRRSGTIPPRAQEMLDRGIVSFTEAYEFLGYSKVSSYPLGNRYLERTAKLGERSAFDVADLRPRRHPRKPWMWWEIPCFMVGRTRRVRTDLLVPMVYSEVPFPGEAAA